MAQAALRVVAKEDNSERKRALDWALSQIDRAFGKGSVMKMGARDLGVATDAVSTGSLGLDIALGIGGLPRGRVIEVYGPESSGKTTLALHVVAEIQKKGGIAAYIDAGHAMDPVYAKKLGADAEGRTRRRNGRLAPRPAGPADEPGAAQADRLDLQIQHDRPLHQSDP